MENIIQLDNETYLNNNKNTFYTESDINTTSDINSTNDINDGNNIDNINNILKKDELRYITKGWNNKTEEYIICIASNANDYAYMHEQSAKLYNTYYLVLKILLAFFSTVLTCTALIPDLYVCAIENSLLFIIIRYISAFFTTVIGVSMPFLHLHQTALNHKQTSEIFTKICSDIKLNMCLYRRDRPIANSYVSNVLKKYDKAITNSPIILGSIYNRYEKKYKKSIPNMYNIYSKMKNLEIVIEEMDDCINNKEIPNFSIKGDITDKDLNIPNPEEFKLLRTRFLKENRDFQYERLVLNNDLYD
jgi:hypothetical protein